MVLKELKERILGRKRVEIPDLSTAHCIVEEVLEQHSHSIMAARAYWQHFEDRSYSLELETDLGQIKERVERESGGLLSCDWAELCAIDLDGWMATSSHTSFKEASSASLGDVRGFAALVNHPQVPFELLVLDAGDSRKDFDEMDEGTKRRFAKEFGERRRGSAFYDDPPTIYVVILSEKELGQFQIETLADSRAINPLPFAMSRRRGR